ncbi:MAG: amidohydrolase family protein [Acidimicrobiia bacterium]|nr:amidohydrolase family protein [Acidimicrobiia bacterium]
MIVDLHTHVLSARLPHLAAETGDPRWPRVVPETDGPEVGEVRLGDDVFRVVRRPFWDTAARVADMARHGVDAQVVSPIPVAITYWAEGAEALRFARAQNDEIAEMVAASGGRLLGLGTVPLQDPDLAVAELARVRGELGLAGVEIGTVVGRRELDHPSLRPFFRAAAEGGVPLFVHPIDGSGVLRCSSPLVDFGLGMHADSALAATALVYGGVLRELGDLRVCLSHGGGSFPWAHPRLALLRAKERAALDEDVARLWADCLVFDAQHLPLLVARYGAGHVVLGSDYPFIPPSVHDPRAPLAEAVELGLVSEADAARVRGANALDFLGSAEARALVTHLL